MGFDFKTHWLSSELSEQITYNGEPISAIVTRELRSNFTMQGLNNQVQQYQIEIEVSTDDVATVHTGAANGDTVVLTDNKGVSGTHRVAEIVRHDPLSDSWVLKLL